MLWISSIQKELEEDMSIDTSEEEVFMETVEENVEEEVGNPRIKHKFNAIIAKKKTFPI